MPDPEQLAQAHWQYVEGMLTLHGVQESTVALIGWHYKAAMAHGYKHGVEARVEG